MTLQKNQTITLQIEGFGAQGEGVARADGMAVFVPLALPGERVEALIVKVDKRCAFARVTRVISASPARVTPPCPYYPRCGGCQCQHMDYASQLAFKRAQVEGCMRHIAGLTVPVSSVLGMENPWRYRNKAALPVAGARGAPIMGYYAARSHRVVDIAQCLIAPPQSDRVNAAVRAWMRENDIAPYDEAAHNGLVRHVVTRVNQSGQVMAVLVINGDTLPARESLLRALRASVPALASLCVSVNRARGNVILGDSADVLWGEGSLEDSLCGLRFRLSPLSFFQVNRAQTERLYAAALDACGLTGRETVADLYCGAGTLSLAIARRADRVIGVEIVPAAVRDARENARRNGVDNARFLLGAAEAVLPQLAQDGLRPDVAVLDPPRKGAQRQVLDALVSLRPRRIVYVSCNPATQARDAAILRAGGYAARACQPVDMFCQTAGVENILLLEREDNKTEDAS